MSFLNTSHRKKRKTGISTDRQKYGERDTYIHTHTDIYIYIYIYIREPYMISFNSNKSLFLYFSLPPLYIDVKGPNEAKVGNSYFELQAINDMEVIF